jgi:hypothetical protein
VDEARDGPDEALRESKKIVPGCQNEKVATQGNAQLHTRLIPMI